MGWGSRVPKELWDLQYASGDWACLSDEREREHYRVVAQACRSVSETGPILDVGCGFGEFLPYLMEQGRADYFGVDLSAEAIRMAGSRHPEHSFQQLDLDRNGISGEYSTIVFNESLYYFAKPVKTLKVLEKNLGSGGAFVVSMCDYQGHAKIWSVICDQFEVEEFKVVRNSEGQEWRVCIVRPQR